MKRPSTSIDVLARDGRPVALKRNGRRVDVEEILDTWVVQGRWWAREECRTYWRLKTGTGVLDVYRRGADWLLSRVMD